MKKNCTTIIICLFCFFTSSAFAQFTFGIEPGVGLKNAYFGYKTNKSFLPYLSVQLVNAKIKETYKGQEDKASGTLLLPTIGSKYYLKSNNKLAPYFNLFVSKPILLVKSEDYSENDTKLNGFFGGLGFGTEYFLDDQFSLGGEFGLMLLKGRYKDEWEDFNGGVQTDEWSVGVNPTYSKLSLNFYFTK